MSKREYVSPRITIVGLASEQSLMTGSQQVVVKNGKDYDYSDFEEDVSGNRDEKGNLWID
ncbi:MAG TPA: hypothetical protein DC006_05790 [Prevotellaceae bacterium]|nr:hypothetical protein [Prevotellaceae bacterium]HBE54720.1 hypothetical protein [Prevotellaceae bacterium]